MAVTKTIHRSFAGGEVSPQMFGRIDDTKFQAGLETCLNFLCLPQGPIERRPGFEYVREVKDSSKKVRLIPFVFNNSQTMVIELGDRYARFHTEGKTLLADNGEPYEIETPWEQDDIFDIHYVQSSDVMTLVHPQHAPRELKRYSATDWRIETINFGPKVGTPSNVKAVRKTEASEDQNADKYTFKYKVSALTADKTAESKASDAVSVVANLYASGTTVEVSCDSVDGAAFYRFYKNQGGVYGYIGDSETPSIIDDNIAPSMDVTPRNYDEHFNEAGGILSAKVVDGGFGYINVGGVGDYTGNFLPTKMALMKSDNSDVIKTDNVNVQKYFPQLLWEYVERSETDYPAYPVADYDAINSKYIKVVDDSLAGNGAVVQGVFETTHERRSEEYVDRDDYRYVYYSITRVKLIGIQVVDRGSGYASPKVVVTGNASPYARAWFTVPVISSGVTIDVQDETGSGAILSAVVTDGVISAVKVVQGGRGYTNPVAVIQSEAGGGASVELTVGESGNYPAAVGYFEQRRCFAGLANDPQRIIMTRSSTESDLSYSLPVQDDDRISAQISSREFNQVRHIVPLSQLLLLTSGSEMRVSPLNSDAITPTSFSVRPQSYVGASMVQPCLVNSTVVYPAARGGHVLELGYNYSAGGYISGDLCLRSAHLFDYKTIKDMTLSKSPMPLLWFISSDGTLLGLTYIPEQQIGSWHRHTTDGKFESVASVAEGDEDHLYVVVQRTINGETKRYIERMAKRRFGDLPNAFFVDCGGTYKGNPTKVVSGFDWLEGKEVHILADGSVCPTQVVTNGQIVLDEEASVVHVGLPYTSDAKTLPAVLQVDDFGQGRYKNVSKITVRTYQSSGIFAGPEFDDLVEYKQRTTEQPGTPPQLVSGDIQLRVFTKWSDSGSICIRQADPLPLTLLSAALEISV